MLNKLTVLKYWILCHCIVPRDSYGGTHHFTILTKHAIDTQIRKWNKGITPWGCSGHSLIFVPPTKSLGHYSARMARAAMELWSTLGFVHWSNHWFWLPPSPWLLTVIFCISLGTTVEPHFTESLTLSCIYEAHGSGMIVCAPSQPGPQNSPFKLPCFFSVGARVLMTKILRPHKTHGKDSTVIIHTTKPLSNEARGIYARLLNKKDTYLFL